MIITFFFNYLNHHQVWVADEMYKLLGDNFHFVATFPCNPNELKGGLDYSDRSYCILATESKEAYEQACDFNLYSDVCVYGAGNLGWEWKRAKFVRSDGSMLSFEVSERWLKRGWKNIFSPRLIRWWWLYQTEFKRKPFYRLCASAFTAQDDDKLGCYKGRHFKWGYFPEVSLEVSNSILGGASEPVRLMWCARFIGFKHPELAIECARKLKDNNYDFRLDMYGDGFLRVAFEDKVKEMELEDVVTFHGNVPNVDVKQAMRNSDIFLFTSDREEGWGAVANEAMAAGCCLVASDRLGAAPYLIRDGRNGYKFRDKDVESLYKIVKYLFDNPEIRKQLAMQGYKDIMNIWNPKNAAESFLVLVENIKNKVFNSIQEGPCSKA